MNDAEYANAVAFDPIENHVAAISARADGFTEFGSQPPNLWALGDGAALFKQFSDKRHGSIDIILCDEMTDISKIARNGRPE